MPEVVKYSLVKDDVDITSLLKDGRKTLCFIVEDTGRIRRHAGNNGTIDSDSPEEGLNIIRGNGDVEAYFRRQLMGSAKIYDEIAIYVHPKHENAFRDVVEKIGFKPEIFYN